MDYKKIAKEFNIAQIESAKLLTNGKTACTYLIETITGEKYILKSMESTRNAIFEYKLAQHLLMKNKHIVPEVLVTNYDVPFVQFKEDIFQLQTFIPSIDDKPPLNNVLSSYRLLQQSFKDFHNEFSMNNRFALATLWKENNVRLKMNFQSIYEEINPYISSLIQLDQREDEWIHGDLGHWNLLFTIEQSVCFIDFSEARKGPKYFDFAAIFASYLPKDLNQFDAYCDEFVKTYTSHGYVQELYETILLWYVKGILSLLDYDLHKVNDSILYFYTVVQMIRQFKE